MMEQAAVQIAPISCGVLGQSILIIEDDHDISDVLSIRLDRQGFNTFSTDNGLSGLALARKILPHLVILDVRLPDIDGFTVCQELVDTPETCDIPVIILSGSEFPDIVRRCRAAGCRYYIRKPYDPNALLALIDQAISETDGHGLA
ncbi:MAG: PleD family two-component system response regulator [Pirellulales bacterium]